MDICVFFEKKCTGLKPASAGKDANRKQTNDRNSRAVHIVWALKRSWENVTRVTGIWRMSFVTGSLWPRLSTSLSFNDTSKHTNTNKKINTHIKATKGIFVCMCTNRAPNTHLEQRSHNWEDSTHRVTCPSLTVVQPKTPTCTWTLHYRPVGITLK